jgi:hypothetical protein
MFGHDLAVIVVGAGSGGTGQSQCANEGLPSRHCGKMRREERKIRRSEDQRKKGLYLHNSPANFLK